MIETLEVGTVLGGYRIEAVLGRGAVGTLYRGRHLASGQAYGLKVPAINDEAAAQRVEAEALALRNLRHPAIPAFHDVIRVQGSICIVRELVEGESLEELLRRYPRMSEGEALAVGAAVAGALAAAHASGIIHRDLKPSNVIVPIDPDRPDAPRFADAKLTDFEALGRLVHQRMNQQMTRTTMAGEIYGTPVYMAPEQALGRPQSAATDIYGLGMLLFEMLYRQLPFSGASFIHLLGAIIERPVAFPSEPPVSEQTRAFISHCLMKREEDRPSSAEEAQRTIALLLRGAASGMTPPTKEGAPSPTSGNETTPARPAIAVAVDRRLLVGVALMGLSSIIWVLGARAAAIAMLVSFVLGYGIHALINRRRSPIEGDVGILLNRATSAADLRKSIAVDVERLIAACREIDQAMMAKTIGILVHEYDRAKKSADRQEALVQAVTLMEKLKQKLSPWYVRHQQTLTWGVALVGSCVGIAKSVADVMSRAGRLGPH